MSKKHPYCLLSPDPVITSTSLMTHVMLDPRYPYIVAISQMDAIRSLRNETDSISKK